MVDCCVRRDGLLCRVVQGRRCFLVGCDDGPPKYPTPQQGLWYLLVIVFVCWVLSWIGRGLTCWFTTVFWSAKCFLYDCLLVWLEVGTGIGSVGVVFPPGSFVCYFVCFLVGLVVVFQVSLLLD